MVDRDSLRLVFFGTPAFAVPTLEALLASRHSLTAVVTQPDRPRGRGQQTTDAPVKARALEAGLTVLQPAALKDPAFLASLAALNADLGVVAAYGKILTDTILTTFALGLVNVHASLLPRYRGAAPIHRAILAGESETGVTIMRVVKALDAGPMLAAGTIPIGPDDTSVEIERVLARVGAALLVSTLDRLLAGTVREQPQDEAAATYAPRLTKGDGLIDWMAGAPAIHNLIRGLHPWPHAFTFANGARLILLQSTPDDSYEAGDPVAPGTIVAAHGDDLRIACGRGAVRIRRLQAEGARPMSAREFLAGHPLAVGARCSTAP
jgi:methionyl-tRNA formyltransferase